MSAFPDAGAAAPIFRLTYVSHASQAFSRAELQRLAEMAKAANRALGVSGLLIECAGEFLQVLEGERETVAQLYDAIAGDPRHDDVSVLATESGRRRLYPDWSMGCFIFTPKDLPDGFFFAPGEHGKRLRIDADERVSDMLSTFYEENHDAGMARSFAEREIA